ncbi:hypothetical protein AB4099_33795 [Bosea sp. 2KB_26]|uniref:hypothetical protein n=1 Tax=Bosea sp. 2KB_26 TaxID=3237475 RepID=UPI003F8E7C61
MANGSDIPTPAEMEKLKTKLRTEIEPAAKELDDTSREQILARAEIEGWSKSQADWLNKLAKEPLFQAVADGVPGAEALEQAYQQAKRQLTVGYFDNALAEGKNRYTAFLTVIDLEKQIAERRNEAAPDYPDAVLMAACRSVEAAAANGASSEEQIEAGYASIRSLSAPAVN